MEDAIGIQPNPVIRNEGRLTRENNTVRTRTIEGLSTLDWYRILRVHHHWTIFSGDSTCVVADALGLARQSQSICEKILDPCCDTRATQTPGRYNPACPIMALSSGTILGQYEIRAPLGAGGMGEVYRGHDARLDREVAIKVLPESLTSDPERLSRFEQEARATAALNHPNILAVYQMATQGNVSYLVEELLNGETLRERLRRGPILLRKAIDYGVQIAHGLAAAHDKGIVHRDLKPENLFLAKDGRVKILDFGLAKVHTKPASSADGRTAAIEEQTDPGTVLGSVGYMSPEQVRGENADSRSDIFALGTILYEMVTGKAAFRKPTKADTISAILIEDPPSISQITPAAPPGMQRLVHRCLEKSPEQRFQSASDLAFSLEVLSDSGIAPSTAAHVAQVGGSNRSRISVAAGAAVLAVLAAVSGAYFWIQPARRPSARILSSSSTTANPRS